MKNMIAEMKNQEKGQNIVELKKIRAGKISQWNTLVFRVWGTLRKGQAESPPC